MNTSLMLEVASAARLPVRPDVTGITLQNEIINLCFSDGEAFLDVIDAVLNITAKVPVNSLEKALQIGGSAWRVEAAGKKLQRRVENTVQEAADKAMEPGHAASDELRAAWAACYGRAPDASDAWDHAIKAAEAALIPVVTPNEGNATLGKVRGQIDKQRHLYNLVLPGRADSHGVDVIVEMLHCMWPNPDRHASGNARPPTLPEAQAVVHLAVTLVQWARDGALTRRP